MSDNKSAAKNTPKKKRQALKEKRDQKRAQMQTTFIRKRKAA